MTWRRASLVLLIALGLCLEPLAAQVRRSAIRFIPGGDPQGVLELTTDTGAPRTLPSWASTGITPLTCGQIGGVWGPVTVCQASDSDTRCGASDDCNQAAQQYSTHSQISPANGSNQYLYISNYLGEYGPRVMQFDLDDIAGSPFTDLGALATSGPAATERLVQSWFGQTNRGYFYFTDFGDTAKLFRCDVTALPCNSPTEVLDARGATAQTALDLVVNGDWSAVRAEVAHSDFSETTFAINLNNGPSGAQAGCIIKIIAGPTQVWTCFGVAQTGGGGDGDGDIYVAASGLYGAKAYEDSASPGGTSQAEVTINQTTGVATLTQFIENHDGGWGHNFLHWRHAIANDNWATGGADRIWTFGSTWIASNTPGTRDFPASNGNGAEVFRPALESEADYEHPNCSNAEDPNVTPLSSQYCADHVIGENSAQDCGPQRNCEINLFIPDGTGRVNACAPSFMQNDAGTGTGEGTSGLHYYRAVMGGLSRDGKLYIGPSNLGGPRMEQLIWVVEACGTRLLAWDGSEPTPPTALSTLFTRAAQAALTTRIKGR